MLDLVLAIAHHLLIFAIFAILFTEFWVVRPGMGAAAVARIAAIDLWYGLLAAAESGASRAAPTRDGGRGRVPFAHQPRPEPLNPGDAHRERPGRASLSRSA